jgi:hypothetical protein
MNLPILKWPDQRDIIPVAVLAFLLSAVPFSTAQADQIETQTGDRYTGKVVSINGETVLLQSDVLGTVRLPRSKISHITFGTNSPAAPTSPAIATNRLAPAVSSNVAASPAVVSGTLPDLGTNSSMIQKVRSQFLAGAGPEANSKFDELLGGYLSGKLTVGDIRKEALSAAEQIRAARKDLGEGAGSSLDSYLAILDNFLKETEPTGSSMTNPPAGPPKLKPESKAEE